MKREKEQSVPAATHLSDYLHRNARRFPAKAAVITDDKRLTWRQLAELVDELAGQLAADLPADKQTIVGLLMPNSWQYVAAYLAIIQRGHIALPIDVIYKPLEISAIISQIKPDFVIADKANVGRLGRTANRAILFDDLLKRSQPALPPLRLPADKQIASLIFTSGTTGKPKAAPYTHANHLWNIKVCSNTWGWDSNDTLLISLRLSHWYGLVMGLSGALYHGNSLYLEDRFNAEQTLKLLSSGRITIFTHGPAVYARMLEIPGDFDLSAVRLFISGSGPLPPKVWQRFKQRFGAEILEVYGSSETGRIASNLPNERVPGSPGRILSEVKLKFGPDSEVLVKSPGVFPGYWKNPTATKRSVAPGGWWRTNDIGHLDNGRLILRGRRQETIRKNGYSVSPRDVEWAIHNFPAVRDVYVLGRKLPGELNDEIIYYLVTDATEADIKDFCQINLPSVWRPDRIIMLPKIPRTPNGKPHLATLKAMLN